jgi:hypothetical protein
LTIDAAPEVGADERTLVVLGVSLGCVSMCGMSMGRGGGIYNEDFMFRASGHFPDG